MAHILKRVNTTKHRSSPLNIVKKFNSFLRNAPLYCKYRRCPIRRKITLCLLLKIFAKEAGVAQGTVSNVLNGRGCVSSDKIILVEQACAKLGYTMNQRAKTLRQGSSKLLAAIIPNAHDRRYTDFFLSFKNYAESSGYSVRLYFSNDLLAEEEVQLQTIRSEMTAGIATFSSCTKDGRNIYDEIGIPKQDVVFVERNPFDSPFYIGFDYAKSWFRISRKANI